MNKKLFYVLVPLIAVAVSSLFLFTTADKKGQDVFQRTLKSTKESSSVIMVNIDDSSVENIGTWPFSRDVYARCLGIMRELGAREAVFDLSFLDKSPAKVDEEYVTDKLPVFVEQYFESLAEGSDFDTVKDSLLTSISYVIRPLDKILADELSFFGDSYLCFTMEQNGEVSEEDKALMETKLLLKKTVSDGDTKTPEFASAFCAISELVEKARNAGIVNASTDKDGYLRRLHPVYKYNGNYYGQLVLVPLLARYGNPEIRVSNRFITLKDAKIDENTVRDIRIPRCSDGSIILKYPKKLYDKYNNVSLWNIYRIWLLEEVFSETLSQMNDNGFFANVDDNPFDLLQSAEYLHNEISANGEDPENEVTFQAYAGYKQMCYDAVENYLSGEQQELILAEAEGDEELVQWVNDQFAGCKDLFQKLKSSRERLSETIGGAMCIFGTTATSTTDTGINLYEDNYPNPGAHYTLANMIIAQDFVDDSLPFVSVIIALVLCLAYSLCALRIKSTGHKLLFGSLMLAGSVLVLWLYYVITKQYPGFVVPVFALVASFVASIIYEFITASKDKKFITNAFSQCLSKEVVNEIVANPDSFKLGGQRVEMTAIFTDIQKFSSFSELLSASQLVSLLNYYLTKMSDIIMEERGTVDKYEGDAIIALVGAPVLMQDHAVRAVTAALKMKSAEKLMNEEILKISQGEMPAGMDEDLYNSFKIMVSNGKSLFTRIGINSGEMIAGYMGSENKKNYTMMGNNVNLASRLEGVNKQYSTGGILISEATRKLLDDSIVVRRLDRVRVVNVNTPIRLYEPLSFESCADEKLKAYVQDWEAAMDMFEAKNYPAALESFKKLSELNPDDNVCKYYISLLEKFFIAGKYPVEADSFGVEYIPQDEVFKLLQK